MTKVSISAEINTFLEKNQSLKSLPKEKIVSIMAERGIITREQAAEFLKNSAFDKGYSDRPDVVPNWASHEKAAKNAVDVLSQTVNLAETRVTSQDNTEGKLSKAINFLKETFDTENKKSNVDSAISNTKKEITELQDCASPEEFKAKFKKLRGVEFSPAKIELCKQKSEEMNAVESIKDTVDTLKTYLENSTVNDASNTGFRDANYAILKTFNVLGIKNKNEVNNILKDIEDAHKNDDAIKKYGGDFRISKNKKGDFTIYRTDKSGFPAEATMEELQIIAKEMKLRLNTAYGAAIGTEIPENATNEQIEKLSAEKYNEIKQDYQTAFKNAYGEKNLNTLAENYIASQKQNTAYVQAAIDWTSIAVTLLGSGALLKGASLLTKGSMPLKTLTSLTNVAAKAVPIAAGAQIARPVELFENLTAKEPDWNAYGMSVKEGAMWMALGMATGALGDKARLFLGQKGLGTVAKNTGKTVDELINLYKSGHKLPAGLGSSLKLIESTAKISGTSAEFTADILMTYAIQKGVKGEDLTFMDYLSSANGALMGTVMHKTFAKISDAEKVKVIQKGLIESNPNMSKAELEKASKTLLDVHRIAEEKRNPKINKIISIDDNVPITRTNPETGKPEFNETGETSARTAAEALHLQAEQKEKEILKLMKKAGLGTSGVDMTHRPKSAQSLYDKIKNAVLDPKHPSKFNEAIKSIRDGVGTRTEIKDFDYKKHPDIVEMYKKDPQKALHMAAERQSQEFVDKVKEIITIQASNPNAKIKAARISNYMGKNGIPYFSEKQVAILRDYAAQFDIDLHIKDELTKVRGSGYTALQMNFTTKDGFTFEWQLRGSKVNKFAECEHVPYDIRENKDVTGGREILKSLYKPLEDTVKNLTPEQYDKYNEFLTAHYEHLRKQELGFDSKAPKLEDFGLNDPKMKAENLELLHEVSDKLKKGEIDEGTALQMYSAKTEKKIGIPSAKLAAPIEKLEKGYILDTKTNKPVKVDINKIKIETNEYQNTGSVSFNDEFGNILGVVTFDTRNNHSGQPSIHFEGLVSNVEGLGIGTKLIEELVKLSKSHGFEGRLTATASPMKGINGKLTNIEFYYKKGFKAVSAEKHAMIEECLRQNKEIPLALNLFTEIEYNPQN